MDRKNSELGTAPIGPLLFKLAVPTVVAQIINMLYNVVDRIYLGHIPGEGSLALTGVGVCLPIILVVSAFAALVASGGAPRASIAMGRGDNDEAERILGSCFSFLIIISIALSVVLVIWNRPMLLSFGASENTIGYASSYMTIYACGTIFVQMTLGMNAFITAQGKTTISMLTVVIGAVMNIILDPIFIFVCEMGVKGAALATILSQCVSSIWCIIYISSKKSLLRLKVKNMSLEREVWAAKLAADYGTTKEGILSQVTAKLRRKARAENQRTSPAAVRAAYSDIIPEKVKNPAAAAAEERLLGAVLRNPEAFGSLSGKISGSDFVCALYRRIYESAMNAAAMGYELSLSVFGEGFSLEEQNVIARLFTVARESHYTEADALDAAAAMKKLREKKTDEEIAGLSGNELSAYIEKIRREKSGK